MKLLLVLMRVRLQVEDHILDGSGEGIRGLVLVGEVDHAAIGTPLPPRQLLLPRHRHTPALFRIDEVIVIVLAHVELHPVYLAGELARFGSVIG